MSWSAWSDNGFGYELFNDHNMKKVFKFIADSTDYKEVENCEDPFDAEQIMDQCCAYTVADIINNEENCDLFCGYISCGDTNQEECIGVFPRYPWEKPKKDLSKEEIVKILEKYAKLLDIDECPDYFEAYYCG